MTVIARLMHVPSLYAEIGNLLLNYVPILAGLTKFAVFSLLAKRKVLIIRENSS